MLVCVIAVGLLLTNRSEAAPRGPRLAGVEVVPGAVLVANTSIRGDAFTKSVVLVLKHDAQGTQGLILNQSMAVPVRDTMPLLAGVLRPDQPIFHGGPVEPGSVRVLAQTDAPPKGSIAIGSHYALVNELPALRRLLAAPDAPTTRFFVGYAGWTGGQLYDEILAGHWTVLRTPVLDLFGTAPGDLWQLLMFEANGRVALK